MWLAPFPFGTFSFSRTRYFIKAGTTITEAKIAPANSLLLVMDRDSGEIPESMNGQLVASTPSCIVVGTLSEADGETSIMLTDEKTYVKVDFGMHKVFSGVLATPKCEVHVCTVHLEPVLKLRVSSTQSTVEIWANSRTEPSKIFVMIDKSSTVFDSYWENQRGRESFSLGFFAFSVVRVKCRVKE